MLILVPTDVATSLENAQPAWLSLWWRIAYWYHPTLQVYEAVKPSMFTERDCEGCSGGGGGGGWVGKKGGQPLPQRVEDGQGLHSTPSWFIAIIQLVSAAAL